MLIGVVRSGLVEARHPVSVAAVDASRRVVLTLGADLDRPFFSRSAAKPFQTAVSQRNGAALRGEELAIASGSHGGQPVHLAYVRRLLAEVGLSEGDLACPPAWPTSGDALRTAVRRGADRPAPIYHNCSGKHAGMLRACAARGWPLSYVDAGHPLQVENAALLAEVMGEEATPAGIDGCGVPTFRTSVLGLAFAFARLAVDDEFAEIRRAMARFASLTADGERPEARIARWVPGAIKGGAMGCVAMAWYGGLGIAAKAWTGESSAAVVGLLEALRRLSLLPGHPAEMLSEESRPPVSGGGRVVGELAPIEDGA